MSTYNAPEKKKGGLPVPAVIAAVVVAIGLLGWSGYKSFGPPAPPPMDAKEKANHDILIGIVKKTNGDYSKVSPEDAEQLKKIAGNFGALAYKDAKTELGIK